MKISSRVSAYTLFEIVIAMLISALVIATAYTAYSIISRTYSAYDKKHTLLADAVKLDELLRRDFRRTGMITKDSSGITCSGFMDTVRYIVNENNVVRLSGIIDTFYVETANTVYTFNNMPVPETFDSLELSRIDHLSFTLYLEDKEIVYHYQKNYSSANLINKQDAGN